MDSESDVHPMSEVSEYPGGSLYLVAAVAPLALPVTGALSLQAGGRVTASLLSNGSTLMCGLACAILARGLRGRLPMAPPRLFLPLWLDTSSCIVEGGTNDAA